MVYIKDEEFIRGTAPMTKEEVRILSIAKLNLNENSRMLDIGAGTGSLSIQSAKLCKEVVAIEKEEEAFQLIFKNIEKFEMENIKVLKGEAFQLLEKVTGSFDSIFVGGSGGNIKEIIKGYDKLLTHKGKIVLNFITVENLCKAKEALEELNYEYECIQVSVAKAKGKSMMMVANNPIFILSGTKL